PAGRSRLGSLDNMPSLEIALGLASDPVRRLAALAVQVVEDAERLWQRLRLSNAEHERLLAMGDGWWRIDPASGTTNGRALIYALGRERFTDRVLLAWARSDAAATDATWRDFATLPARWSAPRFPLRAANFTKRGVPKG